MSATVPKLTTTELVELARTSPTCDLPVAGRAYGLGANASYDAYHRGDFPVRVLKLGRKLRVPTAALLESLGIRLDDAAEVS